MVEWCDKKKEFFTTFFYQSKLRSCDQYQSLIHPRTCWNLNDLILADYDDAYVWKYAKYANYAMYAKYAKYADMQMCNRSKICKICKTKPTKLNIHTYQTKLTMTYQTKQTFRNKPHQSLLVKLTVKTWMICPLLILNLISELGVDAYVWKYAKPNLPSQSRHIKPNVT